MEDIYGICIFLFITLIVFVVICYIWCMCGCPMPEESKQIGKIIVVKDPAKQEEICKLPTVSAKSFFPKNRNDENLYLYLCRNDLDVEQTKFCLKVLLANSGDKYSLRTYDFPALKSILTFLESKSFIEIKQYIFPEVIDKYGIRVKFAIEYVVIDITDLGRKYVEEVR